jgi:hypothetical protein
VATSSSAKKVARLASRGKGKKVRFQGGSIFPIAVVLVVVLGLFVIIYGRQSRPSDGSGVPRVNDGVNTDSHWHAAFGIYICDTFQPKIVGTKEETTTDAQGNTVLADDEFRINGVHSHGDGIIHYHPYSTKSSGNRAKLGVFLDVYDIKLTDSKLVMPPDQGGETWSTDDTKCNGKDTDIVTRVWDDYSKPDVYHDVVTDFNNIRITNDGMVFVVAFVPKGTAIPQPDWAAQLPTLGAADGGNVAPSTTIVGETTLPPTGSTVAGATTTTPAGATTTTTPATTTTGG